MVSTTRVGQCEVCQRWVPRATLTRMPHDRVLPESANYLPYSTYAPAGWACDAVDAGAVSLGVNGNARLKVFADNSTTVLFGTQTWEDAGTLRTTSVTDHEVDVSGWENLVFWGEVGPMESSYPDLIVAAGLCATDGSSKDQKVLRTVRGHRRIWFTCAISGITLPTTDICFYFEVTPASGGQWWADECSVHSGTVPGHFRPTAGAAVSTAVDSRVRVYLNTCKQCREPVWPTGDLKGKPRQESDEVIPTEIWEDK